MFVLPSSPLLYCITLDYPVIAFATVVTRCQTFTSRAPSAAPLTPFIRPNPSCNARNPTDAGITAGMPVFHVVCLTPVRTSNYFIDNWPLTPACRFPLHLPAVLFRLTVLITGHTNVTFFLVCMTRSLLPVVPLQLVCRRRKPVSRGLNVHPQSFVSSFDIWKPAPGFACIHFLGLLSILPMVYFLFLCQG